MHGIKGRSFGIHTSLDWSRESSGCCCFFFFWTCAQNQQGAGLTDCCFLHEATIGSCFLQKCAQSWLLGLDSMKRAFGWFTTLQLGFWPQQSDRSLNAPVLKAPPWRKRVVQVLPLVFRVTPISQSGDFANGWVVRHPRHSQTYLEAFWLVVPFWLRLQVLPLLSSSITIPSILKNKK